MSDTPRQRPFVWPSWIKRLLSGEDKCWWKTWYRVHFTYEKLPDNEFNFDEWNRKHDAIVQRRAEQFRTEGWEVRVEDEGSFKLAGELGDLSGKPDIVAIKDDEAVVSDAKSGKPRDSDHWQVLIYMWALPLSWLGDKQLRGEVEYPDRTVSVRSLGFLEKQAIVSVLRQVTALDAPVTTPSAFECRYCDIKNCSYRYEESTGDARKYF